MRDFVKRARLSADKLPSICFYTLLNSYNTYLIFNQTSSKLITNILMEFRVNCADISDDSTWIVLGMADSTVRVCTICEKLKLKMLKPLQELELLDKESGI